MPQRLEDRHPIAGSLSDCHSHVEMQYPGVESGQLPGWLSRSC
jgi:hypothetical protein